jgi:hypothetical protein
MSRRVVARQQRSQSGLADGARCGETMKTGGAQ